MLIEIILRKVKINKQEESDRHQESLTSYINVTFYNPYICYISSHLSVWFHRVCFFPFIPRKENVPFIYHDLPLVVLHGSQIKPHIPEAMKNYLRHYFRSLMLPLVQKSFLLTRICPALLVMKYQHFFHASPSLFWFQTLDNCCSHLGWFLAFCNCSTLTFCMHGSHVPNKKCMMLLAICSISILPNDSYHLCISIKWKTFTTAFVDSTSRTCCGIFPISIFLCWKLCLAGMQSRQGLEMGEKEGNYKVTNAWKIFTSLDYFFLYTTHRKYEICVPSLHCSIGASDNSNHRNLRK